MSATRQRLRSIGVILSLQQEICWAFNYLTLRHICLNKVGMQATFFGRVAETSESHSLVLFSCF